MKETIEQLPNEPITIWTAYEEYNWITDTEASNAKFIALWNASSVPIYHIVNVSHLKFNMQDLMISAANSAYGEGALWKHPKLKAVIVVTQDPLVLEAMANMSEDAKTSGGVYAQVPMMAVDTLEKALAYIHEQQ